MQTDERLLESTSQRVRESQERLLEHFGHYCTSWDTLLKNYFNTSAAYPTFVWLVRIRVGDSDPTNHTWKRLPELVCHHLDEYKMQWNTIGDKRFSMNLGGRVFNMRVFVDSGGDYRLAVDSAEFKLWHTTQK